MGDLAHISAVKNRQSLLKHHLFFLSECFIKLELPSTFSFSLLFFYFTVQSECGTADVLDDINWGWCGPECAMHNETITWTKDVTFKMTVQYGNAVLVNGLKLYGILLVGISIIGLMIILVLAMGKIALQQKFTIINININSSHDEY